jgi:hypothetical protein
MHIIDSNTKINYVQDAVLIDFKILMNLTLRNPEPA